MGWIIPLGRGLIAAGPALLRGARAVGSAAARYGPKIKDGAIAAAKSAGRVFSKVKDRIVQACKGKPKPKLSTGKQGKHQPGHNNFQKGKSELTHPNPQKLLDRGAGTGVRHGNKEVVDFKEPIGTWTNGTQRLPTTRGTIHYDSKGGGHIVPAHPTGKTP